MIATPTNSIINELKISAENQIPDSNANNIINPNNINLPLPPPSIHSSNINKETESIYSVSSSNKKEEKFESNTNLNSNSNIKEVIILNANSGESSGLFKGTRCDKAYKAAARPADKNFDLNTRLQQAQFKLQMIQKLQNELYSDLNAIKSKLNAGSDKN